jgi:hypothetical protein
VEGNHDFAMGELYGFHYAQPNVSAANGAVYCNDGDYWFCYGNVLFMMLNSNSESVAPPRHLHPRRDRQESPGCLAGRLFPPLAVQRGRSFRRSRHRR